MSKWEMIPLSGVVDEAITGEWGTECLDGEVGTKVLRTTNFTNSGVLNYDSVVARNIPLSKVEKKKLIKNDIILEKSGGSDNQPVGRVVFFDNDSGDTFLCNNFTQVLRLYHSIAYPKYVFLYLNIITKIRSKIVGMKTICIKTTNIIFSHHHYYTSLKDHTLALIRKIS